ncbi:carbohydrate kinase [Pseudohoeflea suaedae]|uniref:Carbohydrate kinase n=1 Tax=Pseudohoeflea suaedae TaxID=877384 RepID=A0A4R5PLE4_9HYPH|nr:FGGY-family carbohydrate kinase [Pseudohoeflea suaedae]TDH36084.1 carbohydrate kinase [Pseudohoeflea suaedae]
MSHIVGIDKGTTATKAVVFETGTGRVVGSANRATHALHPLSGWHEEDMEVTFDRVADCIRAAISDAGLTGADISGVGVSGHMGGLWALGADGRPAGHAIAWPDARAGEIVAAWTREGKTEEIYEISGNAPIPGVPLALLAWLKANDPERYASLHRIAFAKDYINYRLTGRFVTDESDISFFPCDIRKRAFSHRLFDIAGIPEVAGKLPDVLPTGSLVGEVTEEAAERTGLKPGTPVVTGAGDAVSAALGAGAVLPGQAVTVIGTSFMNNLTTDRPVMEPAGVGFLFLMPGGAWQKLMANTGGGSLCLDWALRAFDHDRLAAAGEDRGGFFATMEAEAAEVPPLANGVFTHPYFNTSGMSAPRFIPEARASIFGFDSATGRAQMVRSVMEGVALSMVDCYAALDGSVDEIRLTGGGARSRLWAKICAAAMNRPLGLLEAEETGALGVAVLAAVATGQHPDLATATRSMVRLADTVEPDADLAAIYADAYPLFRDLGRDLEPLWRKRAEILSQQGKCQDTP